MDFYTLINHRQSCRAYDPERPVEKEKLIKMLEAACVAPSACNTQPWHFYCVTGEENLKKVRPAVRLHLANPFVEKAPCLIIMTEPTGVVPPLQVKHFHDRGFTSFDAGIAVAQLCLAAEEEGLSTCILGMINDKTAHSALSIPEEFIRIGVVVGYAAEGDPIREKKRRPFAESVTFVE